MDRIQHPRIVSFVGWSGSGKTSLVEAAIAELARRGQACSAAKCTRHAGDFEPEGKDSARFRKAGAEATAFIGTGEGGLTVLFSRSPELRDRAWLESLFPGASLILSEGLVVEGALKVLVVGAEEGRGGAEAGTRQGKPESGGEPAARPELPPGMPETKRPLAWADIVVTSDESIAQSARNLGVRVAAPDDTEAFVDLLEESWNET